MDSKALAKSKRAHSLHHSKKNNPHRTAKGLSAGSGTSTSDKKPTGNQIKEKPIQTRSSRLPSNWDRYEEEYGSDSGTTDVVVPKSKGADYAYLLSEAKAQAQAQAQYSSDSIPSFDDVLDDFYQGLGPLLSVKGQSKLSWIAEDNFAMEDKAPPPNKASFTSLDLHALAEQLAKASLSERLFIDPDLLPLDLQCSDEAKGVGEDKHEGNPDSSTRMVETESSALGSSSNIPVLTRQGSNSLHLVKDEVWQSEGSGQTDSRMSAIELNLNSVPRKPCAKAASAEAELDTLLSSFTETQIFESNNVSVAQSEMTSSFSEATSSNQMVSTQPKRGHDSARPAVLDISLDDTLDDLLRDTSTAINKKVELSSNEVKPSPRDTPSASQPVSKSKILDDFDSWFDTV